MSGQASMTESSERFGRRGIAKATLWTLAGYVVSIVLRLGSSLVMTRLLAPEMFGLMALSMAIIQGLAMVSDLGLQQLAVSSKNFDNREFRQTLWTVQFARGGVIFVSMVFVAAALLIAGHYNGASDSVYFDPVFPAVLAVLAFGPLLASLEPVSMLGLARQMNARVLVKLEVSVQLVTLVSMITIARFSPTVWALVAGTLCGTVFRLIVAYSMFPAERPRIHISKSAFAEVFRFGKWLTIASALGFTALSGDRLLLGMLVPAQLLGLYAIAHLLVSAAEQGLNKVINAVAFPVLSDTFRNKPERFRSVYYKLLVPIASLMWFTALFLFQVAPIVVGLMYDDRYAKAAEIFSWLSLLLLSIPARLSLQALMTTGDVKSTAMAAAVRTVVSLGGIWLLYPRFGISGAAIAAVLGSMIIFPLVYKQLFAKGILRLELELSPMLAGVLGYFAGLWVLQVFG
jgi:O-antigen/teichoic acid export membrane protein